MFDHFDVLAPYYDRVLPFRRLEQILRILQPAPEHLLLDVGGGTGRVGQAVRAYVAEVHVVDVSTGMLAQAHQKGLPVLLAQSERLPFPSTCYDRILMVDALHHVFHQQETVTEMFRVLKPGGRLVIEEPDLRTWIVKGLALAEKLALMRSHFLTPPQIAELFPPAARVHIETEDYNAWVVVEK